MTAGRGTNRDGRGCLPSDILEELEGSIVCGVCLQYFNLPRLLPCLHVFCEECLITHVNMRPGSKKLKCPLCLSMAKLPGNGVRGFPRTFHHQSLVDTVRRAQEQQVVDEAQSEVKSKTKTCRIHNQDLDELCETCKLLLCKTCSAVPHRNHTKTPIKSAVDQHKLKLKNRRDTLCSRRTAVSKVLARAKEDLAHVENTRETGLNKVKEQEVKLLDMIKDQSQALQRTIRKKTDGDIQKYGKEIDSMVLEESHIQDSIDHIDVCLENESDPGIVQASLDGDNMDSEPSDAQDVSRVPPCTVRVHCPLVGDFERDLVGLVDQHDMQETYWSLVIFTLATGVLCAVSSILI